MKQFNWFFIATFLLLVGLTFIAQRTTFLTAQAATATCSSYQPINAQVRRVGTSTWTTGSGLGTLRPGERIDVSCFAKNGGGLLPGAVIDVKMPNGSTTRVSSTAELRNYTIPNQAGTYSFTCSSRTISSCSTSESISVASITPPSTPPPGCYYKQVQCIKAPCAPILICPTPTPIPTPSPSSVPAPTPTPTPTPSNHRSSCDRLSVASGNNGSVPAKVMLRASASDNEGNIQRYKYYFGDGKQEETDKVEIEHTYETSGNFVARVDIKDSKGNWKTSSSCEATVSVKGSSVESHKAGCSDLYLSTNNRGQAPATASFKVTGFDNKGGLQAYKVDFGNGITRESTGQTFEEYYPTAGTYTVRAYIKDSRGNWHGGDGNCKRTLYIATQPLQRQPSTGTPTAVSVVGLGSGIVGSALHLIRKRLIPHA